MPSTPMKPVAKSNTTITIVTQRVGRTHLCQLGSRLMAAAMKNPAATKHKQPDGAQHGVCCAASAHLVGRRASRVGEPATFALEEAEQVTQTVDRQSEQDCPGGRAPAAAQGRPEGGESKEGRGRTAHREHDHQELPVRRGHGVHVADRVPHGAVAQSLPRRRPQPAQHEHDLGDKTLVITMSSRVGAARALRSGSGGRVA